MTNIRILVEQPDQGSCKVTAYDEYGAVATCTKRGREEAITELKRRVDDRIDGEKTYEVEDLT